LTGTHQGGALLPKRIPEPVSFGFTLSQRFGFIKPSSGDSKLRALEINNDIAINH
jgi:hypothetical protein